MVRKKEEDKRKRILEAAVKVFAREGFYNAKIGAVSQEAQVAHGTIYLYFKSKEDLLVSIFQSNLRELVHYVSLEIQKELLLDVQFGIALIPHTPGEVSVLLRLGVRKEQVHRVAPQHS